MKRIYYLLFLSLLIIMQSCRISKRYSDNFIENILLSQAQDFPEIAKNLQQYEIQVIYTQINRDAQNKPSFKTLTYNTDKNRYFYPASTVKLPVALLALEWINQRKVAQLDKYTIMKTDSVRKPQTKAFTDSTAASGFPSMAHYIKKIFLVSDNPAYNRLFELLGADYINTALHSKGYTDARIIRRLAAPKFSTEDNRYTNPVRFYHNDTLIYTQPAQVAQLSFPFPPISPLKGVAYQAGEQLIHKPFDFSESNYLSLATLHEILKAVIFPEAVPAQQQFDLSVEDYRFLYQCMGQFPRESRFPEYSDEKYCDSYSKYFLDASKKSDLSSTIRSFNKVGMSYGFLIDTAYIVDFEAKTEFMLSAVIYVNQNQILNDDKYEYTSIGFPFFAKLCQHIASHEKKRKREFLPDLSKFQLDFQD